MIPLTNQATSEGGVKPSPLPGRSGTLYAFHTFQFKRAPMSFVMASIEKYGATTFKMNFLQKTTVVVTRYKDVLEVLSNDQGSQLSAAKGYAEFMETLYGEDNILVMEGKEWKRLRTDIKDAFTPQKIAECFTSINEMVISSLQHHLGPYTKEDVGAGIGPYELLKGFSSDVLMQQLLHHSTRHKDSSHSNEACLLEEASSDHYQALTSIPVDLSIPLLGTTAHRKGLLAKETLLAKFRTLPSSFSFDHDEDDCMEVSDSGNKHITLLKCLRSQCSNLTDQELSSFLLLTSGRISSKCLASLLGSFVRVLADPQHKEVLEKCIAEQRVAVSKQESELQDQDQDQDQDELTVEHLKDMPYLRNVLLEIERLFPPLLGVARMVTADKMTVGGLRVKDQLQQRFEVESGWRVWACLGTANRDPDVYMEPDLFRPSRWEANPKPPMPLTWGSQAENSKSCMGTNDIGTLHTENKHEAAKQRTLPQASFCISLLLRKGLRWPYGADCCSSFAAALHHIDCPVTHVSINWGIQVFPSDAAD
ncbi:unnamed protein product [Chrysoparadoxa australica]